jgi:HipA-like protein
MARTSNIPALSIWANGERVGTWRIPERGADELSYDDAWVGSATGRPLSLSLPLVGGFTHKGPVVQNYFDNLLPDSLPIRERIASRFRTRTTQPFDLLQAIGRDCVGAIQLLGEDDAPGARRSHRGRPDERGRSRKAAAANRRPGPIRRANGEKTSCASPSPAPRRRPPCCGTKANGCARTARRPPRTS